MAMHAAPDLPRRFAAEFLGTFLLVAGGCAAAAVDFRTDGGLGGFSALGGTTTKKRMLLHEQAAVGSRCLQGVLG